MDEFPSDTMIQWQQNHLLETRLRRMQDHRSRHYRHRLQGLLSPTPPTNAHTREAHHSLHRHDDDDDRGDYFDRNQAISIPYINVVVETNQTHALTLVDLKAKVAPTMNALLSCCCGP